MKDLAGRPFALIGVHGLDHSPRTLKEVMTREQLNWRSFANGRAISAKWNARSTPAYYIIDHRGVIRNKWMGHPGARAIDNALYALVKELEAKTK
ncbi:MAG: hypothetical protein GWO24_01705 [Akkermansiaceae bacterium]|nr:hypothetical protein [Akkermansiaceae bacterium]